MRRFRASSESESTSNGEMRARFYVLGIWRPVLWLCSEVSWVPHSGADRELHPVHSLWNLRGFHEPFFPAHSGCPGVHSWGRSEHGGLLRAELTDIRPREWIRSEYAW